MTDQIKLIQKKAVPVLKKHPIKRAGIFGSYTRGTQIKSSDIDMLVEIEPNSDLSIFDLVKIQNELGDTLNQEVDLVQYSTIKPALKKYILPHEVRIYEKNN